jgi:hypothetical protein
MVCPCHAGKTSVLRKSEVATYTPVILAGSEMA